MCIRDRNGATALAISDVRDYFTKTERGTISEKSRKGVFWENGDDFSIARAQPSVQGSDATGYKVTLWPSSDYKRSVYVVKEDSHYKVLATSRFPAGIGLEVLDRIAGNDQPGARVPVSYTHLDVYKRQVSFRPRGRMASTPGLAPLFAMSK